MVAGSQVADAGALDAEGVDGKCWKGGTPEEEGTPTPNPCTTTKPWTGKVGGAGVEREPEEEVDEGGKKVVKGGAGGKNPGGGASKEGEGQA